MCKRNILVFRDDGGLDFPICLRRPRYNLIETGLATQDPYGLGSGLAATPIRQRLPATQGTTAANQEFGFT